MGTFFANFVAAFIKQGFTGALALISGLVSALNKEVRGVGGCATKMFVSRRMEPAFSGLCGAICVPCLRGLELQLRTCYRVTREPRGGAGPWEGALWILSRHTNHLGSAC